MRERQYRQFGTLAAVVRFLTDVVFTNSRALHLRDELLRYYARVKELIQENYGAKMEPTFRRGRRRVTKDALREQVLFPLSRRGRQLVRMYPELRSELSSALRVPHKNATICEVADAAERMADAFTPHLSFLIKAKYPRTCLTTLRQDAEALREHAQLVAESRGLLNRSNREVTDMLALARNAIDELDSVLRSLDNYESDYKLGWSDIKHVGARMGRPTKRRLAARERSAAKQRRREEERPTL